MSKTCIIHIGMPKTGTSSVQATLFSARKTLKKQGINYFNYSQNHNALALAFDIDQPKIKKIAITFKSADTTIKGALLKEIKKNKSNSFVISAESLSMLSKNSVSKFHKFLEPHFDNFSVIVYVREPFGFARSATQQLIKSGSTTRNLFENTIYGNRPGWGNVLPFYKRRIENFQHIFGKENLKVKEFNRKKFKNNDLIGDFLDDVLNYQGNYDKITPIHKNVSLDANLVDLYETLNTAMPTINQGENNTNRSVSLITRMKSFSENHIEAKPYTPVGFDLDKYLEVIKDDLSWLKENFNIEFSLSKPNWPPRDNDVSKTALLANYLSRALDSEVSKRKFITHRLLLLKERGDLATFQKITENIRDIPFLTNNAKAIKAEGYNDFAKVITTQIQALRKISKTNKKIENEGGLENSSNKVSVHKTPEVKPTQKRTSSVNIKKKTSSAAKASVKKASSVKKSKRKSKTNAVKT